MKKRILSLVLAASMVLGLAGCCLKHEWQEADCDHPKTCIKCGETEGEALGHDWQEATCTTPRTCARCGKTEGEALGHRFEKGECVSTELFFGAAEFEQVCSVCGEKGETIQEQPTAMTKDGFFLFTPEEYVDSLNINCQIFSSALEGGDTDAEPSVSVRLEQGELGPVARMYLENEYLLGEFSFLSQDINKKGKEISDDSRECNLLMCGVDASDPDLAFIIMSLATAFTVPEEDPGDLMLRFMQAMEAVESDGAASFQTQDVTVVLAKGSLDTGYILVITAIPDYEPVFRFTD